MMNSIEFQKVVLWFMIMMIMTMFTAAIGADFLINCGLSKSPIPTSLDGRLWRSDDDPTFSPPNINAVSTAVSGHGEVPYSAARIFNSTLTYSFPLITAGPKFLRLYFASNTSYNNIPPSQFLLSLEANHLTLLRNFSPYLNSQASPPSCASQSPNLIYEFHLVLNKTTKTLNLSFSPGNCSSTTSCLGFVNGIEIVSAPDGLYINNTKLYTYVNNLDTGYQMQNTAAFQTAYRLNVGGSDVEPAEDAGEMGRAWYKDDDCIAGGFPGTHTYSPFGEGLSGIKFTEIPAYTAPKSVYASQRFIGLESPKEREKMNLTWGFELDVGFAYLARLHFCEMDRRVTGSGQRAFYVYMNREKVDQECIDVWELSGERLGSPIYRDYVVTVFESNDAGEVDSSNRTKVPLFLSLLPMIGTTFEDVLLNGLEILKLNNPDGNLAVPNPPLLLGSMDKKPSSSSHSKSSSYTIIGSILGGGALLILVILGCLIIHRRAKRINKASTTISSDVTSSLPTDLCRRFSLAQIQAATLDFDEGAIVGTGGFGKVYKGSIDVGGCGGATIVAIKRLNPTSKQGAYEFRTEIEMLSRLRHLHLVSLIGYCEEQGEMILVYEYMPRGTLRDHLINHKNSNSDVNMISPLSWKQRLMICIGASRGLHYLHTCAKQAIIHRDVKSSNILLDKNWTAKVSDFGLSRVGAASEMGISHVSTMVKGSFGYLDPEYLRLQQLTEKSDVYSFGVVLFEVLCARAVLDPNLPKEQVNLALWAQSHYKSRTLDSIIDPNLTGQIAAECLRKFGEIAEKCVRNERGERPSMEDVVGGLEFALQLQQTAEKNNNTNGDPLGGFMGLFSSGNVNVCSNNEDELTNSGENLSVDTSITATTENSEEQA